MKRIAAIIAIAVVSSVLAFAQDPGAASPEAAAQAPDGLRVERLLPEEIGASLPDEIIVVFDEDLAPIVSPPFTFDPPVDGSYTYGPDFIVFRSPSMKGLPGLRIRLSDVIRGADSGRLVAPEARDIDLGHLAVVEAVRLDLNGRFRFTFNFPVAAKRFAKALTVASEEKRAIPFEPDPLNVQELVLTGSDGVSTYAVQAARCFDVQVGANDDLDVERAEFSLPKSFADVSGRMGLERRWRWDSALYPDLTLADLAWEHYARDEQQVRLRFSHSVESEKLKEYLRVGRILANGEQPVEIRRIDQRRPDWHVVVVSLNNPSTATLRFHIDAGLKGENKARLDKAVSRDIVWNPGEPRIVVTGWRDYRKPSGFGLRFHGAQPTLDSLRERLTVEPDVEGLNLQFGDGGNSFFLAGEWVPEADYRIVVEPGVLIDGWRPTASTQTLQVRTGKVRPMLEFPDAEHFVFARGGRPHLELNAVALPEAELTISRMIPSNVVRALEALSNGQGGGRFVDLAAETLATSRTALAHHPYEQRTTDLYLEDFLAPKDLGLFCVEARAGEDSSHFYASKLVLRTRLGVLAHWQGDEATVFVHDLRTLEPLKRSRVTVYSQKQQTLAEGWTGSDGVVSFKNFPELAGRPVVVVVERKDDWTFLELQGRKEDAGPFQDYDPYASDAYDGFIYGDRELYRPGETVHLRMLVRTNHGREPVAETPLQAIVTRPDGRELLSRTVVTSTLGSAGLTVETEPSVVTGNYQVVLKVPGAKTAVARHAFQVEAFVPARIKATAETDREIWASGRPVVVRLAAEQLHGGPAPDRKAECNLYFEPVVALEAAPGWHFGNEDAKTPEPMRLGEATTDAEGKAVFETTLNFDGVPASPMRALALASLQELGGRKVYATAEAVWLPGDVALGMRLEKVEGQPSQLDVRIVGLKVPEMTPVDLEGVTVTLEEMDWRYYMRRYYGYYSPEWKHSYAALERRETALVSGEGAVRFDVPRYGGYRVRVEAEGTPLGCNKAFRRAYWSDDLDLNPVARDTVVAVETDKPVYVPGDTARISVSSPYDGRAVVVLQGEQVHVVRTALLEEGRAELEIKITRDFAPNVWAAVTVVHVPTEEAFDGFPFSGFGAANLRVLPPETQLAVEIAELPESVEPQTTLTLRLRAHDADGEPAPGEVTVALVDEGIHLLTGYELPKPGERFFRSRRPDPLARAHYYDRVLYDFTPPDTGGGSRIPALADQIARRHGEENETWIRNVAIWTGVLPVGKDGETEIAVGIPEFTGALRVVAVANAERGVGSAEAEVLVRRPFMLRTSMPRYLLTGDAARCRATVFNTTGDTRRLRLSWRADGEFLRGEGARMIDLPAESEASILADFQAVEKSGGGRIAWKAEVLDAGGVVVATIEEDAPVPVQAPTNLLQSQTDVRMLQPGETVAFENATMLDNDRLEARLAVSALPLAQLEEGLRYIVGYPYGCVEQTTSRCFPLFALRNLRDAVQPALAEGEDLDGMIQSGVERLFTMQTRHGGLAFWPGKVEPYDHGSVYAGHFLTAAWRSRQYDIPEDAYRSLQDYIVGIARDNRHDGASGFFLRAYATYVLALGGRPEAAELIERLENLPGQTQGARALLACAIALSTRDEEKVRAYFERESDAEWEVDRETHGTLHSDLRQQALMLMALQATKAPDAEIALTAKDLVDGYLQELKARRATTHSSAFVLISVAGYLDLFQENYGKAATQGSVAVEDADGATTASPLTYVHKTYYGPSPRAVVRNDTAGVVFASWALTGVPLRMDVGLKAEQNGLRVKRTLRARDGAALDGDAPVPQGEPVVVEVEIFALRNADNVVVADLLPAGLEVENPRLAPETRLALGLESNDPDYFDLRDDRLILFYDRIGAGRTMRYQYVATPVTPGRFTHPPLQAECMYAPDVNARTAPGVVVVEE